MTSTINAADFPPLGIAHSATPKKPFTQPIGAGITTKHISKWAAPPKLEAAVDPPKLEVVVDPTAEQIRPCRDLPHKNRNRYWYFIYSLNDVLYPGNTDSRLINTIKPLYKKYGPTWIWDVEGKPEDFDFAQDERYYARMRFSEKNQPWFGLPPPPDCEYYWKYQQWYEQGRDEKSFSPLVATWNENGSLREYQYFCEMNQRYGANWIWEVMWHNTDDKEFVQHLRYYIERDWIIKNKRIRLIKQPTKTVLR
jgi:hypothetical protein